MSAAPDALPAELRLADRMDAFVDDCLALAEAASPIAVEGQVTRAAGLVVEARGLRLSVGSLCQLGAGAAATSEAEVVGFADGRLYLMPSADTAGLSPGARVLPFEPPVVRPRLGVRSHPWRRTADRQRHLPIGDALLGRVVDAHGHPLDAHGPLPAMPSVPIGGRRINAMEREPIREPLDTGVRAINALLTVGRGQRLGLFAGAGVGKSVLLGMMARYTSADVIVVGLIGERGREVKEFIEDILGREGLARSVVVAAPSDSSPIARLQGATYATAIAEHFRDQGRHVLLLMDSLTRFAMAAREVALAIGEAPATKGYPASVFARLPGLVERTGNGLNGIGSITAFYTVLSEGDDMQDPVADSARSFLDGHLVLTRTLADAGHYPAIDIEQSISRVMTNIAEDAHVLAARRLRSLWARYQRSRELITIGAYAAGADAETDLAIALMPSIEHFLRQEVGEPAGYAGSIAALKALVASAGPAAGGP